MSKQKNTPPFGFGASKLLWGAVCAALGCAAALYMLMTGIRAKSWIETQAVMRDCSIVTGRKGKKSLSVIYEYTFAGRSHTGTRFGFSDGDSIESRLARFETGKQVVCFVNPKNPEEALLSRQMGRVYWIMPGCFFLLAVGLGYASRKTIIWCRNTETQTASPAPELAIP